MHCVFSSARYRCPVLRRRFCCRNTTKSRRRHTDSRWAKTKTPKSVFIKVCRSQWTITISCRDDFLCCRSTTYTMLHVCKRMQILLNSCMHVSVTTDESEWRHCAVQVAAAWPSTRTTASCIRTRWRRSGSAGWTGASWSGADRESSHVTSSSSAAAGCDASRVLCYLSCRNIIIIKISTWSHCVNFIYSLRLWRSYTWNC